MLYHVDMVAEQRGSAGARPVREFLRHQKEIMNWHLEEVGGDRHLVREEAKHFRVMNEVSVISTRPP